MTNRAGDHIGVPPQEIRDVCRGPKKTWGLRRAFYNFHLIVLTVFWSSKRAGGSRFGSDADKMLSPVSMASSVAARAKLSKSTFGQFCAP